MKIRNAHWQVLADAGLMAPPPPDAAPAAWYIRAMQAFGAWLASLFLFAALLALIGYDDAPVTLALLGLLALAAAFAILRSGAGGFLFQASLALDLAGQLCITLALAQWGDTLTTALGVMAVAAAIAVAMDDHVHRLLATLAFCGGLAFAARELGAGELAAPVLAAGFALAWSGELRWGARRALLEPVALGLGFGLLVTVIAAPWLQRIGAAADAATAFRWVRLAVVAAALAWTLRGVLDDIGLRGVRRAAVMAIGVVAALVLELAVPGAGLAALVLVAAIRAQRGVLAVSALAVMLVRVSQWYYALQITLLAKSMWLIGTGAVLLVLWAAARRQFGGARASGTARVRVDRGAVAAMASVVVCLAWAGLGIWRSEPVLAHGRVLVLELAPVDPRSMMQGDYMALGFALQREVRERLRGTGRRDGWVVVSPDENGVARFVGLRDAPPVTAGDALALRFHWHAPRLDMLPDGYFFQEGRGDAFDAARYGAFRVGDDGRVLLQALLDENQQPIVSTY